MPARQTSPLPKHRLFSWAAALAYLLGPGSCLEPCSNQLGPGHYRLNFPICQVGRTKPTHCDLGQSNETMHPALRSVPSPGCGGGGVGGYTHMLATDTEGPTLPPLYSVSCAVCDPPMATSVWVPSEFTHRSRPWIQMDLLESRSETLCLGPAVRPAALQLHRLTQGSL